MKTITKAITALSMSMSFKHNKHFKQPKFFIIEYCSRSQKSSINQGIWIAIFSFSCLYKGASGDSVRTSTGQTTKKPCGNP